MQHNIFTSYTISIYIYIQIRIYDIYVIEYSKTDRLDDVSPEVITVARCLLTQSVMAPLSGPR